MLNLARLRTVLIIILYERIFSKINMQRRSHTELGPFDFLSQIIAGLEKSREIISLKFEKKILSLTS